MPYIATIDTLIQSFQYKTINRTIPTNKLLFKCKLTCSTLCDFCSCNIETIIHLFWECPLIQDVWNSLKSFLQEKGIIVQFTVINVLFGMNLKKHYNCINYIIMLMKYFIFGSKYRKEIPTFYSFKKLPAC